ncbi:MAG: ABC transporter permease [Selenomonas sp.]|nr:ABC transporter permease [Selenomonas sp.]
MRVKQILSDWCQEFRLAAREEWRRVFCGLFPTWLLLIAVPIGYTLLFGYVYSEGSVNHVPLVIEDEDQSSMSRALVSMYEDSEKFDIIAQPADEEGLTAAMQQSEAMAGLIIPQGFAKDIKRGDQPRLELFIDSANNVYGNVVTSAAWEINRTYQVAVSSKLLEGMGMLPDAAMAAAYPIQLGTRIIGNPTASFSPFVLPALAANGVQIGLILTVAPLVINLLWHGAWRRRQYTSALLFGTACVHGLIAFLACLFSLFLACYIFAVPMRAIWWQLLLLCAAFVFFVVGALTVFSGLSPTSVMAIQLPIFYIMPGILYSGMSWPDFAMTTGAAIYAAFLPITYLAIPLRDIMLTGYAPQFWHDLGSLVLGGILARTLAVLIFRGRQQLTLHAEAKKAVMSA